MHVCVWTRLLRFRTFWQNDGYFFVTRLRENAVIRHLQAFELPTDSSVLSHEMVAIRKTQNRFENEFSLIKVLDSKGNELQLLTKRFNLSEDKIEQIYKSVHNWIRKIQGKSVPLSFKITVALVKGYSENWYLLPRLQFFCFYF